MAVTGAPDTPCVFQLADDTGKDRKQFARVITGTLAQTADALEQLNRAGAAVWMQINAGRRGARNVTALRACFVDDDGKGPFPFPRIPPSIIVQSSAGARNRHWYWLLAMGEPVEDFTATQKRLIAVYETDKSIHNLDRVMRLPGSWNWGGGKPGRSREPEQVKLIYWDQSRAVRTLASLRDTHALASGLSEPEAPEGETFTEQALNSAKRLGDWLGLQSVEHVRASPIAFRIRCVWNRAHGHKLMIRVQPRGGFWAGCWHDSCQANRNRWSEVKDKIGGWLGGAGFDRGDDAELGHRLLADLGAGSDEEIVGTQGSLWRYEARGGAWEEVPHESMRKTVLAYAGARVGEKNRLRMSSHAAEGAISCARSFADAERFFNEAPPGILFRNGFLTIVPGAGASLIPHAPENRQTIALDFDYGTALAAPRWLRFLAECFADDEDRADKIALLQEFLGACLVGEAARYQKALMLVGEGENGKSVFAGVAYNLLPPKMRAAIKPQDFGSEYYRAMLVGVRLNSVSETPDAEILSSDSLKAIVTGDAIVGRKPYAEPFTFTPTAGHLFAANRLPGTSDQSRGFWRRFMVLEWNRAFPPGQRELGLHDWLVANELPGIAAWAVAGAVRLLSQGEFTVPPSCAKALETWQLEANPVAAFVAECTKPEPVEGTLSSDVYAAYRAWASANGNKIMSHTSFGRRLKSLGITKRRKEDGQYYFVTVILPPGVRNLYLV